MTEEKKVTIAGGIVAALELVRLGHELIGDLVANPNATEDEVAAMVAATQAKARDTISKWRTARAK